MEFRLEQSRDAAELVLNSAGDAGQRMALKLAKADQPSVSCTALEIVNCLIRLPPGKGIVTVEVKSASGTSYA